MKKGLLLLLTLLVGIFSVSAATYYVDDSAAGTNDGSSWTNAWVNLSYAEDQAGADSLILVADGNYNEDSGGAGYWYINANAANRTFQAVNLTKAIVEPFLSSSSRVIRLQDQGNNVTFVGFTFHGNSSRVGISPIDGGGWKKFYNNTFTNCTNVLALTSNNWHFEGNTINGTTSTGFNGIGGTGKNITIINNTFMGSMDNGAVLLDRPAAELSGIVIKYNFIHNISGNSYGPIYLNQVNASNITIEHNIFGTPEVPSEDFSIRLRNVTDLTINNNTFWAGNFSAKYGVIYLQGGLNNSNLRIINNRLGNSTNYLNLNNGYFFYGANVSNALFENNSLFLNNASGIVIRGTLNGQTEDIIIRNNTLHYDACTGTYGIRVGADSITSATGTINNTLIENNSVYMIKTPCSNHLLFTGKTHYSTIRNNNVHGGGYGILSKHDTYIYTYYNTMANQTNFYSWVSRSGHNSSFFNNTVYANPYNSSTAPVAIQFKNDNSPIRNVTNVTVYDNVFYLYNASQAYRATEHGTNYSNINFTSWNNTFYMNASNPYFAQDGSNYYNLSFFLESFKSSVGTLDIESIFSIIDSIPSIYNNSNTTATTSTIDISWNTQESCNSTISYGTLPTALSSNISSSKYNLTHRIYLTGLSEGTGYYYNVTSCDNEGNCNISETFNFTTLVTESSGQADTSSSGDPVYYEPDADTEGNNFVWTRIRSSDRIRFNHENQEHEINIRSIHDEKVKVIISSEPQDAWLEYGVWRKVDVDQNGGMDISVKVEEEGYNQISVYLEKLSTSYSPSEPTEETSEEELIEEEQTTEEETEDQIKTTNWAITAPLAILALLVLATIVFLLLKKKKKKIKHAKKHHKKRKHKKK